MQNEILFFTKKTIMKKPYKKLIFILIFFVVLSCNPKSEKHMKFIPPQPEKVNKEIVTHGDSRIDPYYWLNERENPKVIEYLNKENDYKDSVLLHTKDFQDSLYNEIVARIKPNDETVPYFLNGYYYYARFEEEKQYPIYCRKKDNLQANEEILLNVNDLALGKKYCSVANISVSNNNSLLAYSVDFVSRRQYTVIVRDIVSGKEYPNTIENTTGELIWANDNNTLFYNVKDTVTLRSFRVKKHKINESEEKDDIVFEEKDDTYNTFLSKSKDMKYIFVGSYGTMSSENYLISADLPDSKPILFNAKDNKFLYTLEHFQDRFFILTNREALNFKLMSCFENDLKIENWKEIIPNRNEVLLEDFDVFNSHLVLLERENGLKHVRIINMENKAEHNVKFNDPTYNVFFSRNMNFNTEILRYEYTSLTTPRTTYDYNMNDKSQKQMKQEFVLGDFKSENYISERIWATASDGIKIPISIVYRKGLKKDGNNPLLQYGYGSYGFSTEADFSSVRLSLLDRGFVFAIAHIRGGQELGRQWYEDGKMLKKKNTFSDFIACTEMLINEKYTNSDKLFAMGGSAGGLLMGVVVNDRPDLYKGIVAAVPFVDVVTTMLDESIPLTTGEFDEWGNPKNKAYYDYIKSYSPYDNVKKQDYPAILITTGLHDSQVQYWEPAKWCAKLRDFKTNDNPVLLYTNMDTGHGGASGRFERFKQVALQYAFILDLVGINK